jgi:hypothetical protein
MIFYNRTYFHKKVNSSTRMTWGYAYDPLFSMWLMNDSWNIIMSHQ